MKRVCLGAYFLLAIPCGCQQRVNEEAAHAEARPAAGSGAPIDAVATRLRGLPIRQNAVRSLAFGADGDILAVGAGDGTIELWNLAEKSRTDVVRAHSDWVFDLVFTSRDELLSGGGDNQVMVMSLKDPASKQMFQDHTDDIHGVAATSDGAWLVTGSDDTRVLARSLADGTVRELGTHAKQVTSVAVSQTAMIAASSGRDGIVKLWDLNTMRMQRELRGHDGDVMSVSFSSDGVKLVSAGYDRTARIWDVATGNELVKISGHRDWVFTAIFSNDGNYTFTGCGDHAVRMFRTIDGELVDEMDLGSDVSDLSLSPDGKLLAAGTAAGLVRFAAVDGEEMRAETFEISTQLTTENSDITRNGGLATQDGRSEQPEELFDYLDKHTSILLRSGNWIQEVEMAAETGDAFTLYLLGKMDVTSLPAEQAQLIENACDAIRQRRGARPEELAVSELAPMLHRAAVADLRCSPIESELPTWLTRMMRSQAASSVEVRDELLRLSEDSRISSDLDQQTWGSASQRIKQYITEALSVRSPDR